MSRGLSRLVAVSCLTLLAWSVVPESPDAWEARERVSNDSHADSSGQETSTAQEAVFGPKKYVRTTDGKDVFTERITLPAGFMSAFVLRVVNGGPDAKHRISSATVDVNGEEVLHEADFSEKIGTLERQIRLTPTSTLQVTLHSSPGSYLTVSILGNPTNQPPPVPSGVLALSPTAVTFAPTVQGTDSGTATVTLTNTLGVATKVAVATAVPFGAKGCEGTIGAGRSCTIEVTFSPTTQFGGVSGQLTVSTPQSVVRPVVALSGVAIEPVKVAPGVLDFGSVAVGSTSAAMSVTITNQQSRELHFEDEPIVSIGGAAASDFTRSSTTCGKRLSAGASCAIGFKFRPSAAGSRTATATIRGEEAFGSPRIISLTGVGAAATITTVAPATGVRGTAVSGVAVTGNDVTHFSSTSVVTFGNDITVSNLRNVSAHSLTVDVLIADNAVPGDRTVSVATALPGGAIETASRTAGFVVENSSLRTLTSVTPGAGKQAQTVDVEITGRDTHFRAGATHADFSTGITVNAVSVTDPTHATVNVTVDPTTALGFRAVTLATGGERATLTPVPPNGPGFDVIAGDATLASVAPSAAKQGATQVVVTITGIATHFAQGTTRVSFGDGITVGNVQVSAPNQLTASLSVAVAAVTGPHDVSATTNGEVASRTGAFNVTPLRVPTVSTGGPYNGTAGTPVSFDASQSTDPDGSALTFAWDFGDGNVAAGATPSHTYANAGQFAVTLRVSNALGGVATASTTAVISAASVVPTIGFVRGATLDDSRSLPLASPTVRVLAVGGLVVQSPSTTQGDDQGHFLVQASEGDALVEVSADGFTSVYRTTAVSGRAAVTLFDARLTPLSTLNQRIASAVGGLVQTASGTQSVQFLAGSLPADTDVRLTPLSGQGLPTTLPMGWSPVAAIDLRPVATNLGIPALWRVVNLAGVPPSRVLTLARFDSSRHRWIAEGQAATSADGQFIQASIDRLDPFVIIAPDAAPFAPPVPAAGSELMGIAEPQSIGAVTATGHVNPRSAPPGDQARAIGEVVLQSTLPLPSGVRLQGRVTQRFDLQGGSAVVPFPFTQDLLAYTDPRTGATSELRAVIPITPSRNYTLQELLLGVVQVDVHQRATESGGTIVDVGGGSFDDAAGDRVSLPPGAVITETVIDLLPLPRDQLSAPVPGGLEFIRGVRFVLTGTSLVHSAAVSAPKPPDLASDAQLLLAQTFYDFLGVSHLRVVAVGAIDGNRIVSTGTVGTLQLPGVTTAGEYAFFKTTSPLAFANGVVFGADGATPRPLALVTAETGPFADLTGGSGRFLTMTAAATTSRVFGTDAAGNAGESAVSPSNANDVVGANLILAPSAPAVISTDPARGATRVPLDTGLRVQFSKAIERASITEASVSLVQGGLSVALQRILSIDGRTLTLLPTRALASATAYQLVLMSDLHDLAGNALSPFQPLTFTTVDTSRQTSAPGQLVARLPDEDGIAMLFATAGTAEGSALVTVINLRTQETMTVLAQPDGSFRLRIVASLGDELSVRFRNGAGQETDFKISQFENEDGLAGLGGAGGTIHGPSGRLATVLPRALVKAGTFRLLAGSPQNLPTLPAGDVVVDSISLTITGAKFNALSSLALSETQGRFPPATSSAPPFTSSASLVVAPDFLVGGALKFRAIAQDAQGNQVRVDASTTVRSGAPNATSIDTASDVRFPRVFVSAPQEAQPNQEVDVTATAPTARVEFDLPPAGGDPLAGYLLVRPTQVGLDAKLAVVDTLAPVSTDAGPRLRTQGRELPGASQSATYIVVGSHDALSFATGRLTGAPAIVVVDGSPFVFEATTPNASFIVPVAPGAPFTLHFVDTATGTERGTFVGQAPASGTVSVGEPLAAGVGSLTVSAKPDDTWLVGIDMPITFTFSERVDMGTVNASTIVVTDGAGLHVFGRFTASGDARTVTFTPLRRFRFATRYRYTVTTSVTAVSGARLRTPFSREFTTFEPRSLATADVGEQVRDVAISGDLAVAAGPSGLSVFGIANPTQPQLQSRVAQPGGSSGVALTRESFSDRTGNPIPVPVAIASRGNETTGGAASFVGVATPMAPTSLGAVRVSPPGAGAGRVAISGSRAAVLDGAGASIIDLTQALPPDPADVTRGVIARSTALELAHAKDVAFVGDKVLVAGDGGLTVLDATSLEVLGTRAAEGPAVAVDGIAGFDLDIDGNGTVDPATEHIDLALAAGGADGTVRFYDITIATAIRLVGVVRIPSGALDLAINSSDRLVYVAAGASGVVLVDLQGPTSVQPVDLDFSGNDDRILGTLTANPSADHISVDVSRRIGLATSGQRLLVLQVGQTRARIVSVLRDPVLAVSGDEQRLIDDNVAYTTDDAIRVVVDTGMDISSVFLTVEDTAPGVLALPGGVASAPAAAGQSTIELRNNNADPSLTSVVALRIMDVAGRTLDERTLKLTSPELTHTALRSIYLASHELILQAGGDTGRLHVGAYFDDGRALNITRGLSGSRYEVNDAATLVVDGDGLLTPLGSGIGFVTVTNGGQTANARVVVQGTRRLLRLTADSQFRVFRRAQEVQSLLVSASYSDGSSEDITGAPEISYVSSAPEVASISSTGYITALTEGDAIITASFSGKQVTVNVAVELAIPTHLTALTLQPFPLAVKTASPTIFATARLEGTGTLAGLEVTFAITGPRSFSQKARADYSGNASALLAGLDVPGQWSVTATAAYSSGHAVSDTQFLVVTVTDSDAEPNNATNPIPLAVGSRIRGKLDADDQQDAYAVNVDGNGELRIDLTAHGAEIVLSVQDANGVQVGGLRLKGNSDQLTVRVAAGRYRIVVTSTGSATYLLTARLSFDDITTTSATPSTGGPGTLVTITGSGFGVEAANVRVLFAGVPGEIVDVIPTQIHVLVPAFAPNGTIRVIVADRSADAGAFITGRTSPPIAQIMTDPSPVVFRLHPTYGVPVRVNRLSITARPTASSDRIAELATALGGSVVGIFPTFGGYTLAFPAVGSIRDLEAVASSLRQYTEILKVALESQIKVSSVGPFDTQQQMLKAGDGTAKGSVAYDITRAFDAIEVARRQKRLTDAQALRPVHLAIIDSGFDPPNGDTSRWELITLRRYDRDRQIWNPLSFDSVIGFGLDRLGHGTRMASIVGARNLAADPSAPQPHFSGVLGSLTTLTERSPFRIDVYETNRENELGTLNRDLVKAAFNDLNARPDKLDIVNISWASSWLDECDFVSESVRSNPGTLFVAAAGNENINAGFTCPAAVNLGGALPNLLVVGAVGAANTDGSGEGEDSRAVFSGLERVDTIDQVRCSPLWQGRASNCGDVVSIVAPGEDVLEVAPTGVAVGSGTSEASALVSSIAGLMKAVSSTPVAPSDLISLLVGTGVDITDSWIAPRDQSKLSNNNDRFRTPANRVRRVNAEAAVRAALKYSPFPRAIVTDAAERAAMPAAQSRIVGLPVSPAGDVAFDGNNPGGLSPDSISLTATLTDRFGTKLVLDLVRTGQPVMSPLSGKVYIPAESVPLGRGGIAVLDLAAQEISDFIDLSGDRTVATEGALKAPVFATGRPSSAISPDGRLLFVATTVGLKILNLSKQVVVQTFGDLPEEYRTDAVTPVNFGQRIAIIDVYLRLNPAIVGVAIAPDGKTLYVATFDGVSATRLHSLNINFRRDAAPDEILGPVRVMPDITIGTGGRQDEPRFVVASPVNSRLYLVHGGGTYTPIIPDQSRVDALVLEAYQEFGPLTVGTVQDVQRSLVLEYALVNFPKFLKLLGLIDNISTGIEIATAAFRLSQLYVEIKGEVQRVLEGGGTLLNAPGVIGAFETSSTGSSEPTAAFRSSVVLGSRRRPVNYFEPIYAKRPSAMAISPDGTQALVSFFATGNFGLLDINRQGNVVSTLSSRPEFSGYLGVTSSIRLDGHLWPVAPDDVPRMFPNGVSFAQSGRFALASHGGSSGHEICATASSIACEQHGGISVIDVQGVNGYLDDSHRLSATDTLSSGPTSFFSVHPLCAAGTNPGNQESICGADGGKDAVAFHPSFTATGSEPITFVSPQAVAIEPFAVVEEPRWGDSVGAGGSAQFTWKEVPWLRAARIRIRLQPTGGTAFESQIEDLSQDEMSARTVTRTLSDLAKGNPLNPGEYLLTIEMYPSDVACGVGGVSSPSSLDACRLSSTSVRFEIRP